MNRYQVRTRDSKYHPWVVIDTGIGVGDPVEHPVVWVAETREAAERQADLLAAHDEMIA